MTYPSNATHLLRIYAPVNQGGHLLIETWHIGDASMRMELAVAKTRYERGEVGHVQLVDLNIHETKTVIP